MLALYVHSFLLLGRKLPRAHAGPSERCRDERRVDTVLVFTLDGRHLATYAAERRRAPLRGQWSRLLRPRRRCVERPENRRHRPSPIDLRRSRQPAGSRRRGAKPVQRAELHPPNKHIHHKETARIETRWRRQNRRSEIRVFPIQGAYCRVLTSSSSSFCISRRVV
jgi:hypothetical protein